MTLTSTTLPVDAIKLFFLLGFPHKKNGMDPDPLIKGMPWILISLVFRYYGLAHHPSQKPISESCLSQRTCVGIFWIIYLRAFIKFHLGLLVLLFWFNIGEIWLYNFLRLLAYIFPTIFLKEISFQVHIVKLLFLFLQGKQESHRHSSIC